MATTKGARNRQIEESQQKAIVQKVAGMTIESVTADLNKTQLAIQKELASLGTAIGEQFAIYDNLVKAIQIKQDELTNLHQIQVTATTLDDLQAQIEQTREEEKQRIQDFDNQWEQRENDRETAWSRRETEYQYHIDQQHRQQEDQFQQTLTTKRREEATRIEDMEKRPSRRGNRNIPPSRSRWRPSRPRWRKQSRMRKAAPEAWSVANTSIRCSS